MNDARDTLVLAELSRHFEAKPDKIWLDERPGHRVSCAFFCAKSTGRPWTTLATFGMSRSRMVMDNRATDTDTPRAELVAYVDGAEHSPDEAPR